MDGHESQFLRKVILSLGGFVYVGAEESSVERGGVSYLIHEEDGGSSNPGVTHGGSCFLRAFGIPDSGHQQE